mgnify:CR=1 FL=1
MYWLPACAGGLFEGVAQRQQPRLAEGRPQERQADRQAVTGQAGWYDVRVRISKAAAGEPEETSPQFAPLPAVPGTNKVRKLWQAFVAGKGEFK